MAKILLIDDEEAVRFSVRKILESGGHIVTEADNGATGLELFKLGSFDMVITDLIMPEKEGIETLEEVKMLSPDTPVLAISGGGRFGGTNYLETAKILGACDALAKPFTAIELLESVNRCLAKQ